jgi:large subunit ribosomal protein L9
MILSEVQMSKSDPLLREALESAKGDEELRVVALLGSETKTTTKSANDFDPTQFSSRTAYRAALLEQRQRELNDEQKETLESLQHLDLHTKGGKASKTVVLAGNASQILASLELPGISHASLDRPIELSDNFGKASQIAKVRPSHAPSLVPRNFSLIASEANKTALEASLVERAKQLAQRKVDAEHLKEMLAGNVLNIKVKTGENQTYSVGNQDIANALKTAYNIEADRRKIMLTHPIKTLGEYIVVYKPHPEVPIDLKVVITAE